MIKIFIDESGNLGRDGKYFIIAAALFLTPNDAKRAGRIIRREKIILSNTKDKQKLIPEIKSYRLKFTDRQRILNKLNKIEGFHIFFIADRKPETVILRKSISSNLAYNYLSRLMLDEIFKRYYDDMEILFDARITAIKSANSLADYLKISAYTKHSLYAKHIDIRQGDSRNHYNLQTADLLAGTIYRSYEQRKPHFLNLIRPKIESGIIYPPGRPFDSNKKLP